MENWGLITYRESSILYDPLETSSAAHQWVAIVIAHELAHQVRRPTIIIQFVDVIAELSEEEKQ
jgi:Peptidase family M1 domain